jgi:quercetin dioxygenase-like cupin family protein
MERNIIDMIEYPEKGVLSKKISEDEKVEMSLFCMAAGTDIGNHTSTKQGIVYVIEGNGIFNLEGKDIKMEKGVIINMKENAVHSLKANDNTAFILTLIK